MSGGRQHIRGDAPGVRRLDCRACSMKVGFLVPGKRRPLMSCAFSRPRWEWMPRSLRKSAWEGRTIEAHRAQIREMSKLREVHHADTPMKQPCCKWRKAAEIVGQNGGDRQLFTRIMRQIPPVSFQNLHFWDIEIEQLCTESPQFWTHRSMRGMRTAWLTRKNRAVYRALRLLPGILTGKNVMTPNQNLHSPLEKRMRMCAPSALPFF